MSICKAEQVMNLLFIAFYMGGATQARRSIKKLKNQTYDQGVFKIFKYLAMTKTDEELEVDMKAVIEIWNNPKSIKDTV